MQNPCETLPESAQLEEVCIHFYLIPSSWLEFSCDGEVQAVPLSHEA
jgi:hypothetical protein